MKKQFIFAVLAAFSLSSATAQMLKGFAYGDQEAPRGYNYVKGQEPGLAEWESPQELSLNKELPKAWFFNFGSEEAARKVLPENSEYYMSLNGTWSFNWVGNPWERPADFFKTDFDVSKWDKV